MLECEAAESHLEPELQGSSLSPPHADRHRKSFFFFPFFFLIEVSVATWLMRA